jgi:hypothetical protein
MSGNHMEEKFRAIMKRPVKSLIRMSLPLRPLLAGNRAVHMVAGEPIMPANRHSNWTAL